MRHLVVGALVAGIAIAACSNAPENARIGVVQPRLDTFGPVASMLGERCGTLDCHGTRQRNLVIWGCAGMRLDANDSPGCPRHGGTKATTDAELGATFRSLVGLEPAVMSNVVQNQGKFPELLTFVRKARGEESHKGGQLWSPGDAADQCVAAWLRGDDSVDCTDADAGATP